MTRARRKPVLALLLLALGLLTSSCVGSNHAFGRLQAWNLRVGKDNRFKRQAIFVVAIPAYVLALTGDFLIFNTVEYWFESNPIVAPRK